MAENVEARQPLIRSGGEIVDQSQIESAEGIRELSRTNLISGEEVETSYGICWRDIPIREPNTLTGFSLFLYIVGVLVSLGLCGAFLYGGAVCVRLVSSYDEPAATAFALGGLCLIKVLVGVRPLYLPSLGRRIGFHTERFKNAQAILCGLELFVSCLIIAVSAKEASWLTNHKDEYPYPGNRDKNSTSIEEIQEFFGNSTYLYTEFSNKRVDQCSQALMYATMHKQFIYLYCGIALFGLILIIPLLLLCNICSLCETCTVFPCSK